MASLLQWWPQRLRNINRVATGLLSHPYRSFRLQRGLTEMVRAFRFCDQWSAHNENQGTPTSSQGFDGIDPANPLWNYFAAHDKGRRMSKYHHYFHIYHKHLEKFCGKDVHLVEIGVKDGGSLEMWRRYLGPRSHITGIDIHEKCKVFEDSATDILVGDQADRSFWRRFREQSRPVDVLIDDGGHRPEQQMVTLEEVLPFLNCGGVYICEDIWKFNDEFRMFAYSMVEKLNDIQFKMADNSIPMPGSETIHTCIPMPFQASINSISFYPILMVIEKNQCLIDRFVATCRGTEHIF
jgi:hypothetical protein